MIGKTIMKIKIIFVTSLFLIFLGYHLYVVRNIKKQTALEIFNTLYEYERETQADVISEAGIPVFSPIRWSRRTAIMNCEEIVYEKYRLWE